MSSNIRLKRICQYCGKDFIARTTTTKYCPAVKSSGRNSCGQRAYKDRIKNDKVKKSNTETLKVKTQPIEVLKAKEFLTVKQASKLLNLSLRTTYRLIGNGTIKAVNLAERKITIRRLDIDRLFEPPTPPPPPQIEYAISECYSIGEISKKYNISDRTVYELINRQNIPKQQQGKFVFVPKTLIDPFLT
jgi:excisionase family DNA binding protein